MLKLTHGYRQTIKNEIRHNILSYAVDLLTNRRNQANCINRNYLRMVMDHFNNDVCSKNAIESKKVSFNYISEWEHFHYSFTGVRKPEDLKICYLSGPEPSNDFGELINLGFHSQNIWAFENNKSIYEKAVQTYSTDCFPFPKILHGSIENFFKYTPKKFDIVYIDACGSIPASEQHSLRIISSLLKYHRLESPGIIITNFALPDISKPKILDKYSNLIAPYLFLKSNLPIENCYRPDNIQIEDIVKFSKILSQDFESLYGHFITRLIGDLASVIIPAQRFANSSHCSVIAAESPNLFDGRKLSLRDLNYFKHNTIFKSLLLYNIVSNHSDYSLTTTDFTKLLEEFMGIDRYKYNAIDSLEFLNRIQTNRIRLKTSLTDIIDIFDHPTNSHQFLDKPNANLLYDVIINQLSYPMHYNAEMSKCYSYVERNGMTVSRILFCGFTDGNFGTFPIQINDFIIFHVIHLLSRVRRKTFHPYTRQKSYFVAQKNNFSGRYIIKSYHITH